MLVVACVALLVWFWPRLIAEGMAVPVTLYMAVLGAMVCAALLARLPTPWTALGAVCFAVSDGDDRDRQVRAGADTEALAVPIWWAYAASLLLITAGFFFGRASCRRLLCYTCLRDRPPGSRPSTSRSRGCCRCCRCRTWTANSTIWSSAEQSDDAQPGVRVRVRFHGRLVDAFILERRSDTDHVGKLGWLDRVVSAEPVLTPDVRRLVDAVAARYAGTRADVLRLAVPPRHANVEKQAVARAAAPVPSPPSTPPAGRRTAAASSSSTRSREGRAARAVWQALPGEPWADRLAEAAAVAVNSGRGVLAIVPDQRDVDALHAAAVRHVDEARVVALSAGLGPAAALPPVAVGAARHAPGWSSAPAARCSRRSPTSVW